jgi:WD40 repeat protein
MALKKLVEESQLVKSHLELVEDSNEVTIDVQSSSKTFSNILAILNNEDYINTLSLDSLLEVYRCADFLGMDSLLSRMQRPLVKNLCKAWNPHKIPQTLQWKFTHIPSLVRLAPKKLAGHSTCVNSIAFDHQGKYLATGSDDKTAILWNASTGSKVHTFFHTHGVRYVLFDHRGSYFATCYGSQGVIIWDLFTGQQIRSFTSDPYTIDSVAFDYNSNIFAICSDAYSRFFKIATGQLIHSIGGESIKLIAFSNNGKHFATCSSVGKIKVWDLATMSALQTINPHVSSIESIAFNSMGNNLITSSKEEDILWDIATGDQIRMFGGYFLFHGQRTVSPDGKYFITPSSTNKDTTIWDSATDTKIRTLNDRYSGPSKVAIASHDAIATAYTNGDVYVWRPAKAWGFKSALIGSAVLGAAAVAVYLYRSSITPLVGRITSLLTLPAARY